MAPRSSARRNNHNAVSPSPEPRPTGRRHPAPQPPATDAAHPPRAGSPRSSGAGAARPSPAGSPRSSEADAARPSPAGSPRSSEADAARRSAGSPPRREHARARRVLGQNLLADPAATRLLADTAIVEPGLLVYEVGAGRGRLTRELLRRGGRVVAYEIDPSLATTLPAHRRLTVRTDDFLAAMPPEEPFAVAGNIPYGLTSAVITWCLRSRGLRRATLLTQWQYARKRTGDYGRWSRLTVLTWPDFAWHLAARVPASAFRPVPRVDGGILVLDRRPVPLILPERQSRYRRMVERGFTGVGGSLHASLSREHGQQRVSAAFRACRLDTGIPVGEVWPEQWLALFRLLS